MPQFVGVLVVKTASDCGWPEADGGVISYSPSKAYFPWLWYALSQRKWYSGMNGRYVRLICILCRGMWSMTMAYHSNKKRCASWTDDEFHTDINNSLLSKNNEWMNEGSDVVFYSRFSFVNDRYVSKICKQNTPNITHTSVVIPGSTPRVQIRPRAQVGLPNRRPNW